MLCIPPVLPTRHAQAPLCVKYGLARVGIVGGIQGGKGSCIPVNRGPQDAVNEGWVAVECVSPGFYVVVVVIKNEGAHAWVVPLHHREQVVQNKVSVALGSVPACIPPHARGVYGCGFILRLF